MTLLIPSSLDECIKHMGEPLLAVDIRGMSREDIQRIEKETLATAKQNGYKNLVLKIEEQQLYVF